MAGALAHLGETSRDHTVGNLLTRPDSSPAPERAKTTPWPACIRPPIEVLVAIACYATAVSTWGGPLTGDVWSCISIDCSTIRWQG